MVCSFLDYLGQHELEMAVPRRPDVTSERASLASLLKHPMRPGRSCSTDLTVCSCSWKSTERGEVLVLHLSLVSVAHSPNQHIIPYSWTLTPMELLNLAVSLPSSLST